MSIERNELSLNQQGVGAVATEAKHSNGLAIDQSTNAAYDPERLARQERAATWFYALVGPGVETLISGQN